MFRPVKQFFIKSILVWRASSVKGDYPASPSHPRSDVDIGVMPTEAGTWDPGKRVNLAIELEDLFLAGQIDLVLLPEADPYLALDIIFTRKSARRSLRTGMLVNSYLSSAACILPLMGTPVSIIFLMKGFSILKSTGR